MIDRIAEIVGAKNVLTGPDLAPYSVDISGMRRAVPLAVARPATTQEVADLVRLANDLRLPVLPVGGRTGLTGGGVGEGALILSFDRMNAIRAIRPEARVAEVEAGAILSDIHDAAEAHDLVFPLTFGARGSAGSSAPMPAAPTCCATAIPAISCSGSRPCCRPGKSST